MQKILAVVLFVGVLHVSLQAQDVFLFVSGTRSVSQQTGDDVHEYEFLLRSPQSAGQWILEIFDAGTGSTVDVRGNKGTTTTFQLLQLPSNEQRRTLITASEERTLNRWVPFDTIVSKGAKEEWLLRVRGGDGDGVNAFKIRLVPLQNSTPDDQWSIVASALPLCLVGVDGGYEVQCLPETNDFSAIHSLVVQGAEQATVNLRDSYGTTVRLPVAKNFQFESNKPFGNRWGVVISGSPQRVNNLVLKSTAKTPLLWNVAPIVVQKPHPPTITILQRPLHNCRQISLRYTSSLPVAKHSSPLWSIGNTVLRGDSVVAEFPQAGTYRATLYLPTEGIYLPAFWTHEWNILVNAPPVASIAVPKTILAPNEVVLLTSTSKDPEKKPLTYQWFINDEYRGNQPTLRFSSAEVGKFVVKLVVNDGTQNSLCGQSVAAATLRVNSQPYGEIKGAAVIARSLPAVFTLAALADRDGDSLRIRWEGNGIVSSSASKEVRVKHDRPGYYTLKVTLNDGTGTTNSSYTTSFRYRVNAEPRPAFALPAKAAPNEELILSAKQSFDPDNTTLSYHWKVSDGSELSHELAALSFAYPGVYTVTLFVDDGEGVENSVQSVTKTIRINAPPQPRITAVERSNSSLISFSAEESSDADGDVLVYHWNFGDGAQTHGKKVQHLYKKSGTYAVTLTVNDQQKLSNSLQTATHTVVINKNPVARFTAPQQWEPGVPLRLDGSKSDDSDGTIEEYRWFLNGTEVAEGETTEIVFPQPGDYAVALQVRDNSAFEDAVGIQTAMIHVNAPPNVEYTWQPEVTEPGEFVTFDARRSIDPEGRPLTIYWEFPDGSRLQGAVVKKNFSASGKVQVRVIVDDGTNFKNGKEERTATILVNNPPIIVTAPVLRTNEQRVLLDAAQSYDIDGHPIAFDWLLPDGSHRHEASFWWEAPTAGVHIITLTVNDMQGKTNSVVRQTVRVNINRPPVAVVDTFIYTCVGQVVLFNSTRCYDPDNDMISARWDFGDGESSDETNPTHVYTQPGFYTVRLSLSDGIAPEPTVATIPLFVEGAPQAVQSFSDTTVCANMPLLFDGSFSTDPGGPIGSFTWDFGDGTTAFGSKVSHAYAKAGTYKVVLTVVGNGSGRCSKISQAASFVHVVEGPSITLDIPAAISKGETLRLMARVSVLPAEVHSVRWKITSPDTVVVLDGINAELILPLGGKYDIEAVLTTTGIAPCTTAVAKREVRVNVPPLLRWSLPEAIAFGEAVVLNASECTDPDGILTHYEWSIDGKIFSTSPVVSAMLPTTGIHTITLKIVDNSGTTTSVVEETKALFVNSKPNCSFTVEEPLYEGETILLVPRSAKDGDGDSLRCVWKKNDEELPSPQMFLDRAGVLKVTLIADDGRGLSNSVDSVSRLVHVLPAFSLDGITIPSDWVIGSTIDIRTFTSQPDVGFVQEGTLVLQRVVEQEGEQILTIGWAPKGKILKQREYRIAGWQQLAFRETPEIQTVPWNPANPTRVLKAPALNRPAEHPIRWEWKKGDAVIGYGSLMEVTLLPGKNVFRLRATDQRVRNAKPIEMEYIIQCE